MMDLNGTEESQLRAIENAVKKFFPLIEKNSRGIEIGVWMAWSTRAFLKNTELEFLHSVDPYSVEVYKKNFEPGAEYKTFNHYLKRYSHIATYGKKEKGGATEEEFKSFYEDTYFSVQQKLHEHRNRVCLYRMDSETFFSRWIDTGKSPVDWVFIDGSHSYKDVLKDLEYSRLVLKPKGRIFCDDYRLSSKPGVVMAVDEFCKKYNYKINVLENEITKSVHSEIPQGYDGQKVWIQL